MKSKKSLIITYSFIWLIITIIGFIVQFVIDTHLPWYLLVFVAMNFGGFVLMAFDKSVAGMKNPARVPELFFHIIALLGSAIGIVVGMYTFRHKTRKPAFYRWPLLILLIQIGGILFFTLF